jgi:hypothetical protein
MKINTIFLITILICSGCSTTKESQSVNSAQTITENDEKPKITSNNQKNGSENEDDTSVVLWKELQNTTTEEQRHDEIRKSMRDYYISWHEKDDYVKSMSYLVNELQKMKMDFYYEPNDLLLSLIPGPNWEIEGPLDITKVLKYFNEERESAGFSNLNLEELRKIGIDLKYSWSEFARQYRDGDEIYRYKSDLRSWGNLMGEGGYLIIRNN